MSDAGLWFDSLYRETAIVVLLFLFIVSAVVFYLKSKSNKYIGAWASLKSWIFAAPMIFFFVGLPKPWPLVALVVAGISGSKSFFKMVGMYHRTWFVWMTYIFIISLGYLTYHGWEELYEITPMIFLGVISLIPLLRNSAKYMIQYSSLSMLAFIFFGWCFMYMGRILLWEQGIYICMYLYILAEFSENASLAGTRYFGKHKLFTNISQRVSIEGSLFSLILTLLLAWGMRHLLPDRSEPFWLAAGIIVTFFGRFGTLALDVVRKDLGIKETGVFIIGRDDIIARVDKLIFVAPIFYYVFTFLMEMKSL